MGLVGKGAKCDISECENDALRSINTQRVENTGLDVASSKKKTLLCKAHYKEWKKETKDERDVERARYDKF
ncbi:MAG: hypothetical protein K8823_1156 [Cenarchaeum symbiont of Oopsacas minuta]|nr:hypothetical protein [Cenarchaeum symbiont of Oopsacas minuta]